MHKLMKIEASLEFVWWRQTMNTETLKLGEIWNPLKPRQLLY